jgi:hypothetical protein
MQLRVSPIFGSLNHQIEEKTIFVLMPFELKLKPIYDDIVKPTVQKMGFTAKRADEIINNKSIMLDIWNSICRSRLIIADVTFLNPNVMYELGMAHTLGKEVILINQKKKKKSKFPFDIYHIRRITYDNTAIGGVALSNELGKTIEWIIRNEEIGTDINSSDSGNKITKDFEGSLLQILDRNRRRHIEWFVHHVGGLLNELKERNEILLEKISAYESNRLETTLKEIVGQSEWAERVLGHLINLTERDIEVCRYHLGNPWLKGKLLDVLPLLKPSMEIKSQDFIESFRTNNYYVETYKQEIISIVNEINHYIEIVNSEKDFLY